MSPDALTGTLPEVSLRFEVRGVEGWTALHLHAREALSRVDEVTVVLASRDLAAAPEELFERRAAVSVHRATLRRDFGGVVRRVEDLGSTAHHRVARVTLAPSLWLLSLRRDARIFQGLNVPAIVQEVLSDAGLYQGDGELVVPPGLQALPPREFCVQYRESDLDFVMRLLEDEGIAFRFARDGMRESLVLVDDAPAWEPVPSLDHGDLRVMDGGVATASTESVRWFDWRRSTVSSSVTLRDFDFTHPRAVLDMTPKSTAAAGALPVYEHPAAFTLGAYDPGSAAYGPHHGARAARVRHQELAATAAVAQGRGDCTGLAPGRAFTLIGHARHDLDGRYVVTEVEHEAAAWSDISEDLRASERLVSALGPASRDGNRYENRFECAPVTVAFRPARVTPKPVISGPQTGFVTAPAGADEEIATDVHGRVLVRFHWERPELRTPTQRGRDSSCWVRVAQSWAGAGWGTLFIPRVGMEVVVHFLEGDPDRPLVTGCVYNGENRPPVALPAEKTVSTVKTSTSLGGDGFNELRFDDMRGAERVFIHAQRDHETVVRRDQTLFVGHDRVKTVEGSEHTTVHKDRVAAVEHNDAVDVGGNHAMAVHGASGAAVRVDASYVLHAQESIALVVGDTSLVLLPDRATLSSRTVHVLGGELVNIFGGITRINCEDGDRDVVRARLPEAARSVGLQGAPGGSLRRSLVALDTAALVRFAASAVDAPMERGAVPERLRERLTSVAREGMTRWFQSLRGGAMPSWAELAQGAVSELVNSAVSQLFAAFRPPSPLGGALGAVGDRVLSGLFQQAQGMVSEAATSGVMHAMALDRAAAKDPFWAALQQRDPAGVQGALASVAKEAASYGLRKYAERHGAEGAREQLIAWGAPGIARVIDEVGARFFPAKS
ncbi:MAG: type VI secretion system tip protein TssI/VgrG [Polyangiales bacterium]